MTAQTLNPNPWVVHPDPADRITYKNPIIPGFYPDPSVCRVGPDYYLITSTFEFFPGVPIFHSRDLIHWQQIGHVIHRREQIPEKLNIFAATVRYHAGTFYMITTNTSSRGTFYMTATDPAGPWSDPIWLDDIDGIDPDLYFDDDGRAYVISSTFELTEIDPGSGKLIGDKRMVWNGTGGRYPEAPHLYKKDGFYYLLAAEGGTEEAHSVTIARSHSIWGPYIDNPANPLLAHATVAGMGQPIQGVGHADMVQAHDGNWWMVVHGYRSVSGYPPHHILGRETCLVPVSWPAGGWPVVNGNGTVGVEMSHPTLPLQTVPPPQSARIDFTEALGLEWNYIQPFDPGNFKHNRSQGTLILSGSALQIGESGSPTFIGRRLTHITFRAATQIDFDPQQDNEQAGLVLVNNGTHFDLLIANENGRRAVIVQLQFGQTIYRSQAIDLLPGPVELAIEGSGPEFIFSYAQFGEPCTIIERADARFLSSETVGWFTGVYVGLYATGNGVASTAPATFAYFEYSGD